MSEEGKILNRGLDALLGSSSTNNQRTIKDIDPGSINAGRFQPRANFDEDKLLELTDSIKKTWCAFTNTSKRAWTKQIRSNRRGKTLKSLNKSRTKNNSMPC